MNEWKNESENYFSIIRMFLNLQMAQSKVRAILYDDG